MGKSSLKIVILLAFSISILYGSVGQDKFVEGPYPTGLIPPSAEELDEIINTWPQIIGVSLNWLGFERVNAIRVRKGLEPLDPRLIKPVGREVENAIIGYDRIVRLSDHDQDLIGDLPVFVDNSKLPYFPPIRSQSPLGSCTSFATVYTQLSYMNAFQNNLDIRDNSNNTDKFSPKWAYNMANGGSDSGSSFSSNYRILERHGACTWAEFPYDSDYLAWCMNTSVWRNALNVRINPTQSVQYVSSDSGIVLVKELLMNGYILAFGTYIRSWQLTNITDDPLTPEDDSEVGKRIGYWLNGQEGPHAMVIVGYNDAIWTDINGNGLVDPGEKGAFRIANSWGDSTWDAGFVWLAYDALRSVSMVPGGPSEGRRPAIMFDSVFLLTVRDAYAPLLIAEFTVNHAKRNQLNLSLGTSETSTETPSTVWTPGAFQNQGGPYAFDGSTSPVDGTFILDFSDMLIRGDTSLRYYIGMSDNRIGDLATLSELKIIDLTINPPAELISSLVPQSADGGQEVYAYIDYAYSGPGRGPELSNPSVQPASGDIHDTFTYYVYFRDGDGDVPTLKSVWINYVFHDNQLFIGQSWPMSYLSGNSPFDGWYYYSAPLPTGSNSYYFIFEDGRGCKLTCPPGGTLSGPDVYAFLLTSLTPSSAIVGNPAFVLTVNGSDFAEGAVVKWDGSDRPTTYISSSRLDSEIGGDDLAMAKTVQVTVRNPDGGLSNSLEFNINTPPTLASLLPSSAIVGDPDFILTVNGSDFVEGAVVMWGGSDRPTTFISSSRLDSEIGTTALEMANIIAVMVRNPDGGLSNALEFTVDNPEPLLVSISPTKAMAGSAGFDLALLGSNFVSSSTVAWNGISKTTTYVSEMELKATVEPVDISAPGQFQVIVSNPAPGGGTSNAIDFSVVSFIMDASPASATVKAGQSTNYTIQIIPQYGSFDSPITFSAAGLPSGCTATFSPASVTPGANPASTTLTLTTKARTASATGGIIAKAGYFPLALGFLLLIPVFDLSFRIRRLLSVSLSRRLLATVVLICLIILIGGCSADGVGSDTPSTGTQAGSYQITALGTSGNLTISTTVTLIVQ